jgi:GGDEF domain-containing protein
MLDRQQLESFTGHRSEEALLDKVSWHSRLVSEVQAAQRDERSLAVLFVDVNYFKDVNDILGHEAGDKVIADIRHILEKNLRISSSRPSEEQDVVAVSEVQPLDDLADVTDIEYTAGHIGGDEFAIMCRTDEKGAQAIVQRLRDEFNTYLEDPSNANLANLDISLAVGVSVLQPNMTSAELLRLADSDMYRDKLLHLPSLSDEQKSVVIELQAKLEDHNIRLRDVGKYLLMLSKVDKP